MNCQKYILEKKKIPRMFCTPFATAVLYFFTSCASAQYQIIIAWGGKQQLSILSETEY